jgi:hypothetical protein
MRDKNFNTGVRGVLLDARHYERMGSALWLYSWLVLRQTHQTGSIGWVLGGAPVSYREIEEETGFNRRTIHDRGMVSPVAPRRLHRDERRAYRGSGTDYEGQEIFTDHPQNCGAATPGCGRPYAKLRTIRLPKCPNSAVSGTDG